MLCAPFGVAATNSVPTNFISIHLVAKPGSTNTFLFSGEKFDAKPILADADFVEFDADRQTFTVKGPAALRISNAIHSFVDSPPTILNGGVQELIAFPTVFVLEAEGKPIYRGRFHTLRRTRTEARCLWRIIMSCRPTKLTTLPSNVMIGTVEMKDEEKQILLAIRE
jgi:hypothetical protein